MKFIVDAHLPPRLVEWINQNGHDAIHTRNLPEQNLTEDIVIIHLSMNEERCVISKDQDFYQYYLLHGKPYKLLMITTGNILNRDLMVLFESNFSQLVEFLETNTVVEINNTEIFVHF